MHHWLRRCGRAACPRPQRKALDAPMIRQDHGLPSVAESARRSRSGKPTLDNVRDLDYLADRYQTLYHSTASAALMTPVVAHLSTLGIYCAKAPRRLR